MILTPSEQNAVGEVASSYEIDGDPEALVDDALQAICTGQADEVAYEVSRAAGVEFIGEFIWSKIRRALVRADHARAIIKQAKEDDTYEGPIPEDDTKAVSEANSLVALAEEAWSQQVRGPEVESILRLAAEFAENGDEPEAPAATEDDSPPVSQRPRAKPPQTAKGLSAPDFLQSDDLEELSKIEPWEGYGVEKVSDIVAGINAACETYNAEQLYDLMRNIWAYESLRRNRKTILDGLIDIHEQIEGKQEADEAPAQVEEEPPPAQAGEDAQPEDEGAVESAEPGDADEDAPGEGDGEEVAVADREGDDAADAGDESGDQAPETVAEEEEPPAVAEPDEDQDEYQRLITDVEDQIKRERMHTPQPPAEAPPEVPWDWTKISDGELQTLYSTFSGFAYYVDYRYSQQSRIALHCKQAADEMARELLVATAKYDEKGKEVRVTFLEAEIEDSEAVKRWRRRQRKHDAFASALRSERDGYYKLLENLSRHESMRLNEWQRAGGKPGSFLRRGNG